MLREMQEFLNILDRNRDKKIVIWGAGQAGRETFELLGRLGVNVGFFVDKAVSAGSAGLLKNMKVFNPVILKEFGIDNTFVIIASMYYEQIADVLTEMGYEHGHGYISMFCLSDISMYGYHRSAIEYLNAISKEPPLFKTIEIETLNRCNNDCPFCPINRTADTREFNKMKEELFYSILEQLKMLNYSGYIALFSNNEPYLDKRIINFLQSTKEMLPEAYSYIFTNGSLLTMDLFIESMKWLDLMVIDNYDDSYEFVGHVKEIYHYCKDNPEIQKKVRIIKRLKNEKLTTRGGQAPNRETIQVRGITCILPFQQFIVRPDGRVSLCCNDALGKYTLGDLNTEKIIDVWYGKKYNEIRENILEGRENIDICSGCDTLLGVPSDDYKVTHGGTKLLTVAK